MTKPTGTQHIANAQATRYSTAIKVWDMPTRLFHWSLVLGIFLCWLSMEYRWLWLHQASGLGLLFLLCYRFIWGFIGSGTARFREFITPPTAALRYLKASMASGKNHPEEHHSGHNPAGGWMVLAMLVSILLQIICGLFANDDIGFYGPLADRVRKATSDAATALHGQLFKLILALIWLHLVAVFFYLLVKKQNLIKAMINGKKPRHQTGSTRPLYFAPPSRMLLAGAVALSIIFFVIFL